jgi:hypothetical protein
MFENIGEVQLDVETCKKKPGFDIFEDVGKVLAGCWNTLGTYFAAWSFCPLSSGAAVIIWRWFFLQCSKIQSLDITYTEMLQVLGNGPRSNTIIFSYSLIAITDHLRVGTRFPEHPVRPPFSKWALACHIPAACWQGWLQVDGLSHEEGGDLLYIVPAHSRRVHILRLRWRLWSL